MSGPSGQNTKSSKIERILTRVNVLADMHQLQIDHEQGTIADQQRSIEELGNSLKLATETAHRLEAENARLRTYLGSVLFQRRKVESIPMLGPQCSCSPGTCKGESCCRHPSLEPEFGNRSSYADQTVAKYAARFGK